MTGSGMLFPQWTNSIEMHRQVYNYADERDVTLFKSHL